jgi:hypothetical protein
MHACITSHHITSRHITSHRNRLYRLDYITLPARPHTYIPTCLHTYVPTYVHAYSNAILGYLYMYISAVHTQRKRKRTRCPHWDCTRGPKAVGAILSTYRAGWNGRLTRYDRIWQCLGRLWWLRSTPRCCSTQLFQNHYFLLEALCSAFGFSIHPWNSFLAVYVFSPNLLLFRDGLPVWTCFTICPTLAPYMLRP